jgi:hypothetical protein
MLFDFLGDRIDRFLLIGQTTFLASIILIATASCTGLPTDLPPPIAGIVDIVSEPETPKQQLVQRDEAQPKVRRPASKKASTPPKPDAQSDEQLYQEFLEWQMKRREQRSGQAVRQ